MNDDTVDLQPLPRYLRPGLRLLFIGYNPGIESARQGHYYAFRGNVFWGHLTASGLSGIEGRPLTCLDDELLFREHGIGFTDLCHRPTAKASELTREERIEGVHDLHRDLLDHQPRFAVFSSRGVFNDFGNHALLLARKDLALRSYGAQPERIGETIGYVIPSSSGLASGQHKLRLELLHRLAALTELATGN